MLSVDFSFGGGYGDDVTVMDTGRSGYTYFINSQKYPKPPRAPMWRRFWTMHEAVGHARLAMVGYRPPARVDSARQPRGSAPTERCVMCGGPLDCEGRCDTVQCDHYFLPVPVPDYY